MNTSFRKLLNRSLVPLLVIITLLCTNASSSAADTLHLRMGNPSQAAVVENRKDNFLIVKDNYALSFNDTKGTPNWVSWRLTRKELGNSPRFPFEPDMSLPPGSKVVTPKDYAGSGFDRGHMCPHSDRSADDDMSQETFLMSNMIPQSPNVNQKAWAQLEMYCRNLVEFGHKTLYIVCGPAGQGGQGKKGFKDTIGTERSIVVPAKCWKVILVLEAAGADDPKKVTHARLISVIMPNDMSVGEDWASHRKSLSEVETLTGYKFFDKVSEDSIDTAKNKKDEEEIEPSHPIRRSNDN